MNNTINKKQILATILMGVDEATNLTATEKAFIKDLAEEIDQTSGIFNIYGPEAVARLVAMAAARVMTAVEK